MTASVAWTIRCDRIVGSGITCGATVTLHVATLTAARATLVGTGWTRSTGADACPEHSRRQP